MRYAADPVFNISGYLYALLAGRPHAVWTKTEVSGRILFEMLLTFRQTDKHVVLTKRPKVGCTETA
jgi:hypothetical protein